MFTEYRLPYLLVQLQPKNPYYEMSENTEVLHKFVSALKKQVEGPLLSGHSGHTREEMGVGVEMVTKGDFSLRSHG